MTATGSAAFVSTRSNAAGIFTDFAPPNVLLATLGIPMGTLVKQVDHQIHAPRARPIASDFQPPNLLLSVFVVPTPPFHPVPTSDSAQHLIARWAATDFSPPVLLGRFLGPPPLHPVDLMGDEWSAGKISARGIYSDFIPPNVLLDFPPTKTGPYVPVEIGTEINRKGVYTDFAPPNIALNTIALIGSGQSFRGRADDVFIPRRWTTTDFQPPNFLTSQLQINPPFVPQDFSGSPTRARWSATDFQPPNLLTSTFGIFLGNPPKISVDPNAHVIRRPGIFSDTPSPNFLAGVGSIAVIPPLSAQDDMAGNALRARALPSDFIPPNLFAGTLVAAGPPQPPAPITLPFPGLNQLPYTFNDVPDGWRRTSAVVNQLIQRGGAAPGTFELEFQSGSVLFNSNGQIAGVGGFQYGLSLPNASGNRLRGLLLGGAGETMSIFICDEQIPGLKGITRLITAGDAGDATSDGGDLLDFAGGSLGGNGGTRNIQGGTSVYGRAGDAVLSGGNATGNVPTAIAGNAVVSSGQEGKVPGNVILSANTPPGATGVSVIRHQFGTATGTILGIDMFPDGSMYLYMGGGFGNGAVAPLVTQGPGQPAEWASNLPTGTFSNGTQTLHIVNGLITQITTP